jgi:hypothetical protein
MIDRNTGKLSDYTIRSLGSLPVKLAPTIVDDSPALLALSSVPWLFARTPNVHITPGFGLASGCGLALLFFPHAHLPPSLCLSFSLSLSLSLSLSFSLK